MNEHQRLVLARGHQHVEQLHVVDTQTIVGHEDLKRRMARLDQRRNFVAEYLLARIGEDHVEAVIDDRAAARQRVVILDHLGQAHADMLRGEAEDARRAAKRCRSGRAFERIGVDEARGGQLLDMRMRIDAAGHDVFAGRIDLALARREVAADGGDRAAGDGDIGTHRVGCGDDGAVADDDVVRVHRT